MKVQYQISGTYRRLLVKGTNSAPLSLTDLIKEVQAVATHNQLRSLPLLQKSFALEFLPKPILVNLFQQAQGVTNESELYHLSSLQLLHAVATERVAAQAKTYCYQFVCPDFTLDLTPDDAQIPTWLGNEDVKSGFYTIILESPHHPSIPADFIAGIWQQAVEEWQNLTDIQKINTALNSPVPHLFCLSNQYNSHRKIWAAIGFGN